MNQLTAEKIWVSITTVILGGSIVNVAIIMDIYNVPFLLANLTLGLLAVGLIMSGLFFVFKIWQLEKILEKQDDL